MVPVVIVGCGQPKKSMGWKHAQNIVDGAVAHATLHTIVEPFYLQAGKDTEGGIAFHRWIATLAGVQVVSQMVDMPAGALAVIATRTADTFGYFVALLERGVRSFYIEKPGATSVEMLHRMAQLAEKWGAQVAIGYARNGSKYYQEGLADFRAAPADVTFTHNNSYEVAMLDECFARNGEGMVKNMACHELAMAVCGFGLRSDTIVQVSVDPSKTILERRGKFEDFRRLCFAVRTAKYPDCDLVFDIDRCGGDWCGINVRDAPMRLLPDDAQKAMLEEKAREDPELQRYFILQDADYVRLLSEVATAVEAGAPFPDSVPTLRDAGEVLEIAEFVTPLVKEFMASHLANKEECERVIEERKITLWTAVVAA